MKKIVLTGGGTAGHVTPNLALVPELRARGYEIRYVGSYDGMEKQLAEDAGLPYTGIDAGKLRRYFSWKNLTDPVHILRGFFEARKFLRKYKPDAVFSKGGYVSAPVVWAAHTLKIPAVIHESDITPGLANRLCYHSAVRILCSFPETLARLPKKKSLVCGCPIRRELFTGSREAGLAFTGLPGRKPVLLVVGGSSGALSVNESVLAVLPRLLETFEVVHLTGKGKNDGAAVFPGYRQYEYIGREMKDLLALADVVISRAGANAICELLALQKPALLLPYGMNATASRGDQVLNARSFVARGFCELLDESVSTPEDLLTAVLALYENRDRYIRAMAADTQGDAVTVIADLLDEIVT